jgi:DNA-binding MarR family transcriptional regulator
MTRENSNELKSDIADFLGIKRSSKLLGWFWRELLKGNDSAELAELYAQKQAEWEQKKAETPKTSLRDNRPPPVPKPPRAEAPASDDRARTLAAVKAFMSEICKGLSPEEIEAKREEIKRKAAALL